MNFSDIIGKPFADGGRGPDKFDCWGLAKEVFLRYGIELPDYCISANDSKNIAATMATEKQKYEPVTGEWPVPALLIFRTSEYWAGHCGVYIGYGKFIHAHMAQGVVVERVETWRKKLAGVYVPLYG